LRNEEAAESSGNKVEVRIAAAGKVLALGKKEVFGSYEF
jgi:hypothetical protein